jgi:hypothetical protein
MAEFSISNIYTKFSVHAYKNVFVKELLHSISTRYETVRTYSSDMEKICAIQMACQLALNKLLYTNIKKKTVICLILKTATWFRHVINSILWAHRHDSTSEGIALSFSINIAPWLRSYKYRINDNDSEVPIEIWEEDVAGFKNAQNSLSLMYMVYASFLTV